MKNVTQGIEKALKSAIKGLAKDVEFSVTMADDTLMVSTSMIDQEGAIRDILATVNGVRQIPTTRYAADADMPATITMGFVIV